VTSRIIPIFCGKEARHGYEIMFRVAEYCITSFEESWRITYARESALITGNKRNKMIIYRKWTHLF